jgi:DNA-binding NtrC family response regulator
VVRGREPRGGRLPRARGRHGREALAHFGAPTGCSCVVLLDLRLPDSDDLGLLRRIREIAPACRIILMTAHGTPEILDEALRAGAYGVLGKPFDMSRVVGLVQAARPPSALIRSAGSPKPSWQCDRPTERYNPLVRARILVVDDEQLIRWSLNERLTQEGHEVIEAGTAKEAVAAFSPEIDLVLLDFRLPDSDGLQVLKQIKNVDADVPVIMLTAVSGVETAVEAMKHGAHHYATSRSTSTRSRWSRRRRSRRRRSAGGPGAATVAGGALRARHGSSARRPRCRR